MPTQPTFRKQIQEFWKWFPNIAQEIAFKFQEQTPQEELSKFIDETFVEDVQGKIGGLSWAFGPGVTDDRTTFTLTGEGQTVRQLLSHFWLSQKVEVPGWDFYCSRQPTAPEMFARMSIDVGGCSVNTQSMMIATDIDDENQVVNIKAWHESFSDLDETARFQILYLLLDEGLGEFGTQTQLGGIEFKPVQESIPIVELPGFMKELWESKGWERTSPLETYSGYQAEPSDGFVRADTIAGYTCIPQVLMDYLNQQGKLDGDPLDGTGAELLFVEISDSGVDDHQDAVKYRTGIEEELSKRLAGGGGYVIGGATGTQNSYVDLISFDGQRTILAIEEAVDLKHNGQFVVHPFVK